MTISHSQSLSKSQSKLSCFWCSHTTFMECHMEEYVDYRPDASFKIKSFGQPPSWLKPADSDLLTCLDCVMTYHKLVSRRNHLLNIEAPYQRTVSRITEHFEVRECVLVYCVLVLVTSIAYFKFQN